MQGDLVLVGRSTGFGEENAIFVWEHEVIKKALIEPIMFWFVD